MTTRHCYQLQWEAAANDAAARRRRRPTAKPFVSSGLFPYAVSVCLYVEVYRNCFI